MTYYVGSSSYPHSSVVYIEAYWSNGAGASGSGVVVGQNDVLTASHVIYSAADGGVASTIYVYPGRDGTSQPYGSYTADRVSYYAVDSDGDGLLYQTESQYDLAVLGFSETFGTSTGWFGIDPNAGAGNYYVTGYPGVYRDSTGPRMTEDYGYMSPDWSTTTWNHTDLEVNSGNSGGPLWYYVGGQPYVVGVVSTASWSADVYGYYNTILGWISGNNDLITSGGGGSTGATTGTSGADVLAGTTGADIISGATGNDTISGGEGNDIIYGNHDLDVIYGDSGNDTIFGGQNTGTARYDAYGYLRQQDGVETIYGGDGNDMVYGNYGGDVISGGAGNDTLYGGQNEDTVIGGDGADHLFGNRDNDTLSGGDGADTFHIGSTGGADRVNDFTLGVDRIAVDGGATYSLSDVDGTARLTVGGSATLDIIGVSSSQLQATTWLY